MKKPLLIDNKLDNFYLDENTAVFINPKYINLIECKKAKLTVSYEPEEGETEGKMQELEGYNTRINTTNSPRDRFSFFSTSPDLEWLKRNATNIGLSKIVEEENGNLTFINKDNILDILYKRKTKDEIEKDGKDATITLFFSSPSLEIADDPKQRGYESILQYSIDFNIKDELKEERPYTIINDFLNTF